MTVKFIKHLDTVTVHLLTKQTSCGARSVHGSQCMVAITHRSRTPTSHECLLPSGHINARGRGSSHSGVTVCVFPLWKVLRMLAAIVEVHRTFPRSIHAAHSTQMGRPTYLRTQQATKNLFVLLVLHFAKAWLFETHVRPVVCGASTGIAR
jgi:hypothetical protein